MCYFNEYRIRLHRDTDMLFHRHTTSNKIDSNTISNSQFKSIQSVRFYKAILVVLHVALALLAIGALVYKIMLIKKQGVIYGLDKIDIVFEAVILFFCLIWTFLLAVRFYNWS